SRLNTVRYCLLFRCCRCCCNRRLLYGTIFLRSGLKWGIGGFARSCSRTVLCRTLCILLRALRGCNALWHSIAAFSTRIYRIVFCKGRRLSCAIGILSPDDARDKTKENDEYEPPQLDNDFCWQKYNLAL